MRHRNELAMILLVHNRDNIRCDKQDSIFFQFILSHMTQPAQPNGSQPPLSKTENPLVNFGFNLIIPTLLLLKGESWLGLDPKRMLVLALAFPVVYFFYDLYQRRKINGISILGFVSILLTGGIGLLELPPAWIAIKEAAVPLVIGCVVLGSIPFNKPIVRLFLINDKIIHRKKVEQALIANGNTGDFTRALNNATAWVAVSFLLSAILNYTLARWIVTSPAGTTAFNEELGKLAMWSYPVIVLPSMIILFAALWLLIKRLQSLTGLKLEEILVGTENG